MTYRLTLLAAMLIGTAAAAQPSFIEVSPTSDLHFSNPDTEDFWIHVVAPADVDGDGDLDYLVAGGHFVAGGNGLVEAQMHLYRNGTAAPNAAPSLPSGLSATLVGGEVTLTWQSASDEETPASALTYDLELRAVGQTSLFGKRLPQPGNLGSVTHWALAGLPPGRYAWLCAVDSAYQVGGRALGVFSVPGGTALFADGFESGTTAAWSLAVP